MFTGLIEDLGTLHDLRVGRDQARVTIASSLPAKDFAIGESIAVNGVCLTVTNFEDKVFSADVSPETLNRTTLGRVAKGTRVNLERALRLSDRLGGHLVTGHVDGLARILERSQIGNAWKFRFQADPALSALLVAKGSVAVDGISLTVNEVSAETFTLAVIPHTLAMTNLQDRRIGDEVNIETDLIGKYVAKFMQHGIPGDGPGVTLDLLAKYGFL
ncbi:MAG: riboflavin synthase [Desulfuromonadales bacterium]